MSDSESEIEIKRSEPIDINDEIRQINKVKQEWDEVRGIIDSLLKDNDAEGVKEYVNMYLEDDIIELRENFDKDFSKLDNDNRLKKSVRELLLKIGVVV